MDYTESAKVLKALADPNRVKILVLLSYGTLCACEVLEHFNFIQPTLSHHIKVLVDAGLVTSEKKGTWHRYSLDHENAEKLLERTVTLFQIPKLVCISDTATSTSVNGLYAAASLKKKNLHNIAGIIC